MSDPISRQAAIDTVHHAIYDFFDICEDDDESPITYKDEKLLEVNKEITRRIGELPSVEPTMYGYSIEHLAFIAHVLQREDLPPEKIMDLLTDIGRVVKMIADEQAVTIRKAMEQWMT